MLTAGEIMTDQLITVRPEDSIEDAIQLLLSEEISGMPVSDDKGHLVGVITEFALLGVVYDRQINNQTVEQHMTRELITVDISDPVSRIADLCIVHRVRRLPVMKHSKLVGVIARRDVLRALHEAEVPTCAS